jgi:hypothetical protein
LEARHCPASSAQPTLLLDLQDEHRTWLDSREQFALKRGSRSLSPTR